MLLVPFWLLSAHAADISMATDTSAYMHAADSLRSTLKGEEVPSVSDLKNGFSLGGHSLMNCDTSPVQRALVLSKVRKELIGSTGLFNKKEADGPFTGGRRGFWGSAAGGTASANPTTAFGSSFFLGTKSPVGFEKIMDSTFQSGGLWGTDASIVNATFFLGRQDAYVSMICTPPPVRYFHFRTFSYIHFDGLNDDGELMAHTPVAGLGETINQATVNTTGGADGADPFGKTAVIISTADMETFEMIASAFEKQGIPRTAINLDILPSRHWIKYLDDADDRPGLASGFPEDDWQTAQADALSMIGRITGFLDEKDSSYAGSVAQAFLLHRRPGHETPHLPIAALPDYTFRQRGTGKSENVLAPQLELMRTSLVKKMADAGFALVGESLHQKDYRDEYRCLTTNDTSVFYSQAGGFCDMQPLDVSYSIVPYLMEGMAWWMRSLNYSVSTYDWDSYPPAFKKMAEDFQFNDAATNPDATDRVFVNVGVNHNTIKNVGYNSIMVSVLGLNAENTGSAWETATNSSYWYDDEMEGSGAAFGDGFDNLFALATARPSVCEELSDLFPGQYCAQTTQDKMSADLPILAVERIYLETDTGTGPDLYELLQAEFLLFERV